MRRKRCWAAVLLATGTAFTAEAPSATAGFFCFGKKDCKTADCQTTQNCEACRRPKKCCCLLPPDAPDAEVGFAVPGVVRPGQAIQVSESSMRRAAREAAVRDLKAKESDTESSEIGKTCEERLDVLERDMREMKSSINRLTIVVEKLAESQAPKPLAK